MMSLGFGDGCDPVHKVDRRDEIFDLERLDQLLAVLDLPAVELRQQWRDRLPGEWWRATAAGAALLIGEIRRHWPLLHPPPPAGEGRVGASTFKIVPRSASSGPVSSQASTISLATASGVDRRLTASTLASFQRRAPLAVSASAHKAARTPATLFAAIETPVPVQQNRTPCWQAPDATRSPTARPTSTQSRGWSSRGPWSSTSIPTPRR